MRVGERQRREFGAFRKRKYEVALSILGVLFPLAVVETLMTSSLWGRDNDVTGYEVVGVAPRHLLQEPVTPLNCTPRSVEQFPDDFMTLEQRIQGGVVFHIFIALYGFVATAIACDDFFVPSLEKICQVLKVQPDVAGATFMAAGSSAPEFFAAVIGIFFAKSDIGLSTIVGSAVFNLLLVNAVVGLMTGMVIYLTWWPVIRDCGYYTMSVVVLLIVMADSTVHWYESLIMVLLYVLYVFLMYFNRRVGNYLMNNTHCCLDNRHLNKAYEEPNQADETDTKRPLLSEQTIIPDDPERGGVTGGKESSNENSGAYGSLENQEQHTAANNIANGSQTLGRSGSAKGSLAKSRSLTLSESEPEFESLLSFPAGFLRRILWFIMLPAIFLMVITTPDFRRGGCWAKAYWLTFLVSCMWLAGLSYIMVWMVTIAGDTFNIPDTVMGITLLAIGTSVPDAIASLIVAKDGYGDMAVSNSIGSNVFDILLCLGLPWLIQTGMVDPGSEVPISSKGLTYSTITLLGTIVFLVVGFMVNRWRLNKVFGGCCLGAYVVVITFSCLYELNVFGDINLPPCPRSG